MMATKRGFMILLVVFVVGMAGYMISQPSPGSISAAMAPEMDLPLSPPAKPTKLSALKGKVVLLDFWATWCGPCKMSMPSIQGLYTKFKDRGLEVIGISEDEPGPQVHAAIEATRKDLGVTYPTALAADISGIGDKFGHNGIPALYVIDKQGKIRDVESGWDPDNSEAKLDKLIAQLLDE